MKLLTKVIEKKAKEQYELGSDLSQKVVAKFFDPCSAWTWYLMNIDPSDLDYCWGIVKGFEVEIGSFSLSDLTKFRNKLGIGIERDLYFKPMVAKDLWGKLINNEHV